MGLGRVVVANDWCIHASNNLDNLQFSLEKELSFLNLFLKKLPIMTFLFIVSNTEKTVAMTSES